MRIAPVFALVGFLFVGLVQVPSAANAAVISSSCGHNYVAGVIYPTLYCDYTWGPGGYASAQYATTNTAVYALSMPGVPLDTYNSGFFYVGSSSGSSQVAVYCWTPSDVYTILGQSRIFLYSCSPLQGCYYSPASQPSYSQAEALLTPEVLPCPGFGG